MKLIGGFEGLDIYSDDVRNLFIVHEHPNQWSVLREDGKEAPTAMCPTNWDLVRVMVLLHNMGVSNDDSTT